MAEIRTRWVTTAGNLSNLRMKTEEISEPGAKEVQIAVQAVGFNFADLFACLGLYRYCTPQCSGSMTLAWLDSFWKSPNRDGEDRQYSTGSPHQSSEN